MSFGTQLKARREAIGLSRGALAERLGVSASAIGNYETGISFPKEEVLLRLFDALHTAPNRLFCESFHAAAPELSDAEQTLIETCRALSPVSVQALFQVADALRQANDPRDGSRRLPLYTSLAAVGYAAPLPERDLTHFSAGTQVPRKVEFAVRVSDDPAALTISDGGVIYTCRSPLNDGDVGLFFVEGTVLCRQYHQRDDGAVHLFAPDRQHSGSDLLLPPSAVRSLVCLGRVLLPAPLPLPEI